MLRFEREGVYNIVSTKSKSENLSVNVAFVGEFPPENFFIINKFSHNDENNLLFKVFFQNFHSENRMDTFCDFFSKDNYFCAIFKYIENQNLKYKYNKKVCIDDFESRIKVFEGICIKIRSYMNKVPNVITLAISDPENILIDDNNQIFFNVDLQNIDKYKEEEKLFIENKNKYIVKKLSEIFKCIFEVELDSKYNKIMHLIYDKGILGLYKSIEEYVVDLKKNSEKAKVSSFISYIKYQYKLRKKNAKKYVKLITIPLVASICVFLIYKKIKDFKGSNVPGQSMTIGEITYSGGADESAKSVDLDNSLSSKVEITRPKKPKTISKDADIDFTDYIVKFGDTPSSIAESYYGDKSLSSVITSFNETTGHLVPGSILRLPVKSVVDQI